MRSYRAAPSKGRWILAGIALALILPVLPVAAAVPWILIIVLPLAVFFLLMVIWYPTIRYELGPEELVLRFGPFRYAIKLAEIDRVTKKDLMPTLWSSMRLPGFAMFTVYYSGEGSVFMCATRAAADIVLITAGPRKYGITPLDEQGFLDDLLGRLGGA